MAKESYFHAAWRLNKVFPLLIGALLILNVLLFGLIFYVVSPRLDALERRYIGLQSEARQGKKAGSQAESPQTIYRAGQQDLVKFREAIPPRTDFTALIEEIFSLAGNAGLAIDRISYKPKEEAEKNLLRYDLAFSVTGDYGQIKKFIYSLEQSGRLIAIEEISWNSGEEAGPEKVGLRLTLSTYFRVQPS